MTHAERLERNAKNDKRAPMDESEWRRLPNGAWVRFDYSLAAEPGSPEDCAKKREWEEATKAILMDWARRQKQPGAAVS